LRTIISEFTKDESEAIAEELIFGGLIDIDLFPYRRINKMASNKTLVPEAKAALERFKMEAASEVGVTLKQGYNGDLTSKQAGSVGGQMVKKMISSYESSLAGK
jgi:small acid-soluble spore protein D (minor alpha/beta-type SASP)